MNKTTIFIVVILFLYLFCSFDPISATEKGFDLNSIEHMDKSYDTPHKPPQNEKNPNKTENKPKINIKKKNKMLRYFIRCIKCVNITNRKKEFSLHMQKSFT